MFSYLKSSFYTATGKDTSIVFIGTLINIIAGGLFFVFVPRILGPSDYGLFSTVIATGLMAASIANFGMDTGILRFVSQNQRNINPILSLAIKSYLFSGLTTGIVGFLLAPKLAVFLNHPEITQLLRIAFAGTIFILLTNFFISALQAKKQFYKASIVNLSSNVLRLLILFVGSYFVSIGLYFLTLLFFFVTITSVIIGKIYLPFNFEKIEKSQTKNFFKYNFWIAMALIISAIPFDNYYLLKLSGPFQTGLYAAPFKILTFAYQFGGNFTRVLASRFASFDSDQKAILFAKKATVFPIIFATGFLIIMIFSPFIYLLIGPEYIGSSQILIILSLGFIFFFFETIPSSIILYYFGKSKISFLITAVRYLFFIILLGLFVPTQKAAGAAIAFSLSQFISLALMSLYVFFKFSRYI